MKLLISVCFSILFILSAPASSNQFCEAPDYQVYIEEQFAQIEARNRRLLAQSWRDYELSLTNSTNPYEVITNLSRHLTYSAQFEPIIVVNSKIDRIFEHANELTIEQQIAGDLFDKFSSETHAVGIARAWIAYRQGELNTAFEELIKSINVTDSALLSSFGPDFSLVRQIYRDGHIAPVVAYIKKTETFWIGKRQDELRSAWLKMIEAGCKVSFDSTDTIKAVDLGLTRSIED